MKLSPEQFDALVEYINAKAAPTQGLNAAGLSKWADRIVDAYGQLEEQLKGDHYEP
jgi:hypothetical protein